MKNYNKNTTDKFLNLDYLEEQVKEQKEKQDKDFKEYLGSLGKKDKTVERLLNSCSEADLKDKEKKMKNKIKEETKKAVKEIREEAAKEVNLYKDPLTDSYKDLVKNIR